MTQPGTSDLAVHAAIASISIPQGKILGLFSVNKFGRHADLDTGGTPCTVWSGAEPGIAGTNLYTYSAAAAILYASSTNAGDTQTLSVQGLDANWNLQTVSVTLNGQNKVQVGAGQTFIRVFRVTTSGPSLAGDAYIYEDDTLTAGKPDTDAKVRAVVKAARDQTEMSIYSVAAGYTALITGIWLTANRTVVASSTIQANLRTRMFGASVFPVKSSLGMTSTGTQVYRLFNPYLVVPEKSDIEVRVDTVTADNTILSAEFDLILVSNTIAVI